MTRLLLRWVFFAVALIVAAKLTGYVVEGFDVIPIKTAIADCKLKPDVWPVMSLTGVMPLMRLSEGAWSLSKELASPFIETAAMFRASFTATTNQSSAACVS